MPRTLSTAERRARAARIRAASRAGETADQIAAREGVSVRTIRRTLASAKGPLEPLAAVQVLEVDPFHELGLCITAHREAIERLRTIAADSGNAALVIGASKASASLSGDLVQLLTETGLLPQSAFDWRSELQWQTAWSMLSDALDEAGVDVGRFVAEVEHRLAGAARTDVELANLGPDPRLVPAA